MPTRKLRLDLSDTFFLNSRWAWEETGQIHVVVLENVHQSEAQEVAQMVGEMLDEFGLPVKVSVGEKPDLRTVLLPCMNECRSGKHVDDHQLVSRINQARRASSQVGAGLILLVSPDDVNAFSCPGEEQPGFYGSSHPDGICLLRVYRKEAVRHEMAHMLGLGRHCDNPLCVMRWECPTATFCPRCVRELRRICQVDSA